MAVEAEAPLILFGAFDRHNFGDLLFPHIATALLPDAKLIYAGLAERDLSPFGGHRVRAIAELARELGDHPATLIHAGGELLTCDAWQAAVMLTPADQVQDIIARFETRPAARLEWARGLLGMPGLAPYAVARALLPTAKQVIYNAVGGVDLDQREPALRAEVLAKLKAADRVSVRDRRTLDLLEAAGIPATLVPDPAVMVAELFGETIRGHGDQGEAAHLREAFPQGYLAVQFSADFGDDATLSKIAAQLDRAAAASGLGIALFRAGAAPWHDNLAVYRRLARRMRAKASIFRSLHLWDICALIAHSRCYCGSSLHGGIVAGAFALPHLWLLHAGDDPQATKQAAYAGTWPSPCSPATATTHALADALQEVLGSSREELGNWAKAMAARYREAFAAACPTGSR
jgi:hypothetical protein